MIATTTRGRPGAAVRLARWLRRLASRLERRRVLLVHLAPADLDRRELRIIADRVADVADQEIARLLEARRIVRAAARRKSAT